jgi:serine/threonine protein phosphatase PrpC
MPVSVRIVAFSHRGRVRAQNEDTIAVGDWLSAPEMAEPRVFRQELAAPLLCAVCDGMGGHRAGAVASRLAARGLAGARIADARTAAQALRAVDAGLYEAMAADAKLAGMGTTAVGLVLSPRLVWFNVGDSRLYRYSGRALERLSIDDTPPGPRSGLLTQSLGGALMPWAIAPHASEEALRGPARFLLCSDGLTDMLGDGEIADCLALPDGDAVIELFELAMRAGGLDNISLVLASVQG